MVYAWLIGTVAILAYVFNHSLDSIISCNYFKAFNLEILKHSKIKINLLHFNKLII